MRTQLRIVAGEFRGRKLNCNVGTYLRPTPQRVREALFSILGNAVPERLFVDVFAGTGIIGLEALSRGAKQTLFVERDFRSAGEIEQHVKAFGVRDRSTLARADVYRWAERWQPPAEPVNLFVSPPFADLTDRLDAFLELVALLWSKLGVGSVIVLQGEDGFAYEELIDAAAWEVRKYGRNLLLIRVKESATAADGTAALK
ncbi:MAG TPA: RsmD family RNA methyltransferase [Gemmataceae bacterium]|jgi:16S rRNA (guanine(966)-N(2))-methyltransferase RsmD